MAKTVFNPELSDAESEIRDRLIVGVFHNFGYKRKRPKHSGPKIQTENPDRKSGSRIIESFQNGTFNMPLFIKDIKSLTRKPNLVKEQMKVFQNFKYNVHIANRPYTVVLVLEPMIL